MRKVIVAAAVAVAVCGALGAVTTSAGAAPRKAEVALPAPTGPYPVGTKAMELVDRTRRDPWVPSERYRRLMVGIWYPARDVAHYPMAAQFPAGTAAAFDQVNNLGLPPGKVDWAGTKTHAHTGAPEAGGQQPVVLYSPGVGDPRDWNTMLVEELASRGYTVVTIDHTYDASAVEFPDHSVAKSVLPDLFKQPNVDVPTLLRKVLAVRVADTKFVLDALHLHRVGMFGQSGGGFEGLQLLHDDSRVAAVIDMDGIVGIDEDDQGPGLSPLANSGVTRPFLLMGSAGNDHYTSTSWARLWQHSPGWKRDLHLRGAEHQTYTDAEALVPQIAKQLGLSTTDEQGPVYGDIGWIDPARAIASERAYLTAFFDRWLRHRDSGLLTGPSPRYPSVIFVR